MTKVTANKERAKMTISIRFCFNGVFKCVFQETSETLSNIASTMFSKTCLKRSLKKRTKVVFQDRLSLNACQKYCRMLQREHSEILSTFIKLLLVIKIFVLSILEWLLKRGFTVLSNFISSVITILIG